MVFRPMYPSHIQFGWGNGRSGWVTDLRKKTWSDEMDWRRRMRSPIRERDERVRRRRTRINRSTSLERRVAEVNRRILRRHNNTSSYHQDSGKWFFEHDDARIQNTRARRFAFSTPRTSQGSSNNAGRRLRARSRSQGGGRRRRSRSRSRRRRSRSHRRDERKPKVAETHKSASASIPSSSSSNRPKVVLHHLSQDVDDNVITFSTSKKGSKNKSQKLKEEKTPPSSIVVKSEIEEGEIQSEEEVASDNRPVAPSDPELPNDKSQSNNAPLKTEVHSPSTSTSQSSSPPSSTLTSEDGILARKKRLEAEANTNALEKEAKQLAAKLAVLKVKLKDQDGTIQHLTPYSTICEEEEAEIVAQMETNAELEKQASDSKVLLAQIRSTLRDAETKHSQITEDLRFKQEEVHRINTNNNIRRSFVLPELSILYEERLQVELETLRAGFENELIKLQQYYHRKFVLAESQVTESPVVTPIIINMTTAGIYPPQQSQPMEYHHHQGQPCSSSRPVYNHQGYSTQHQQQQPFNYNYHTQSQPQQVATAFPFLISHPAPPLQGPYPPASATSTTTTDSNEVSTFSYSFNYPL